MSDSPLFISAAVFEHAPLREYLPTLNDTNFALCGIGPLAAAKAAERLADAARNRDVIFIGTAGVFGEFISPYVARAVGVRWLQADERLGHAYAVDGIYPRIPLPTAPPWATHLPATEVLCTSTISLDPHLPTAVTTASCVENLELYSCAGELLASAKSFVALFGITNTIGRHAHQQWQQHHAEAARLTAKFIAEAWTKNH